MNWFNHVLNMLKIRIYPKRKIEFRFEISKRGLKIIRIRDMEV